MYKITHKLKDFKKNICQQIRPYRWEYLFGCIFVGIILFSEMYGDFFATYRDGVNFWYAFFEGHPLSFYSYVYAYAGATPNRTIVCGAAYDFTIYFFFALWNLPAWIYERISGNYAESCFLLLAWGKLMLPAIAVLIAGKMKSIYEYITKDSEDTATMIYVYFFSGILILAAYFIGQYDIIGVLFAVYGVDCFLRKKYKKFYLYFALAITCKYFAVLLFICLVLLYEKRILYIIRDLLAGCSLVVVEKVLFSLGKSYVSIHPEMAGTVKTSSSVVATGLLSTRMGYLFQMQYDMGVDTIAVFVLIMGLLAAYCYLQKPEDNYSFYYRVIYISFVVNTSFILFTASTPYWAILLVPWFVLMVYCNDQNRKFNILVETIGISSFMIWHMAREAYFFNSGNCEGMLMYYLLGEPPYFVNGLSTVMQTLSEGSLSFVFNMCRYVFYTCMIILMVVNFPRKDKQSFRRATTEVGMRGLLIFRELCMVGIMFLPVAGYIVQVVFHDQLASINSANEMVRSVIELLVY